jgi:hypothetical protein
MAFHLAKSAKGFTVSLTSSFLEKLFGVRVAKGAAGLMSPVSWRGSR